MDITKLGGQIRYVRNECGLSQAKLAEKMGIDDKTISKWENGQMPTLKHLVKLADAMGCSIEHLLGFIREKNVDTSWIVKQIPLNETTIDALRSLKKECDKRTGSSALQDEELMTQYLTDGVIRHIVMDQPHGGANETLMTLAFKLVGALKIVAEYEAIQMVGDTFAFGKEMLSAEELLELQRNPPERYRMAIWEKEMCEKNIGELISSEISDLLKAYINTEHLINDLERGDDNGNL